MNAIFTQPKRRWFGLFGSKRRAQMPQKPIIITTLHRGVFFGLVDADKDLTAKTLTDIKSARMAIYFGTTRGINQLCRTGPTENSTISDPSDIECLQDVTAVFSVTGEAAQKWMSWNSKDDE